jgi:histone H3/H4
MSRHKVGDLSKKLGLKEKPAKIGTKKMETNGKKTETNFKFQSRVKNTEDNEFELEHNVMDLSNQEIEVPSLIPADSSLQPQLTEESLQDFDFEHQPSKQDDETSSVQSFVISHRPKSAGPKRPIAPKQEDDDISELPPVNKPSRTTAPRETIDRSETVPRQSIIRLIRSSQLNSAGAELVDAVKELIVEFSKTVFESVVDSQRIISASNLHKYMGTFIANEDKDLNNDVIISPVHFERLIRPIIEENKYILKRDTFFLLHLFVETVMIKVLQGSDMVADAAKRQRVSAKDVLVSYSIYMM